jgi:hypothetical protein
MNKLITNFNGGEPIYLDDIRWNDEAYRAAITSIVSGLCGGIDCIIQGCELVSSTIGVGYVFLSGEILQVDSHTKTNTYFTKITTYDELVNSPAYSTTFKDGSTHNTHQINRATATGATGTLAYNGATLLSLINKTSKDAIDLINGTTIPNLHTTISSESRGVYTDNNIYLGTRIFGDKTFTNSEVEGLSGVGYYSRNIIVSGNNTVNLHAYTYQRIIAVDCIVGSIYEIGGIIFNLYDAGGTLIGSYEVPVTHASTHVKLTCLRAAVNDGNVESWILIKEIS